MNILESKNKNEFDDELNKIIFMLSFNNKLPTIAGSASLASQKYYSDYDLFLDLSDKYNIDKVYKKLESILNSIINNPNLFFMELKMQLKNGKKYRWFYGDKFEYDDFKKKFDEGIDFIKLDLIARIKNIFTEISIIYKFSSSEQKKEDYIKSLTNDIKEYKKDKNYYKILKRFFSIFKQTKNYKMLKLISEFLNSDTGAKYQIISNLDTIKNLLSVYDDETTKKQAMFNLKELNLDDKLENIDNIIKDYRKDINIKALDFIKRKNLQI